MSKTLNTLVEKLRRLYPILLPISVILLWVMGFSLLSFSAAESPSGQEVIPTYLDGRVPNHGSYYRWFTIANHPFLFAFSIILFLGSCFIVFDGVNILYKFISPYIYGQSKKR